MTRPRRETGETQCETMETEYRGHSIVVEPSGRTVVAKNGLYCAEFGDSEDSVNKAKEYIDGLK